MENLQLKQTANEIRKGIVTAVHSAKSGHPGGSLSAADIFTRDSAKSILSIPGKNTSQKNYGLWESRMSYLLRLHGESSAFYQIQ